MFPKIGGASTYQSSNVYLIKWPMMWIDRQMFFPKSSRLSRKSGDCVYLPYDLRFLWGKQTSFILLCNKNRQVGHSRLQINSDIILPTLFSSHIEQKYRSTSRTAVSVLTGSGPGVDPPTTVSTAVSPGSPRSPHYGKWAWLFLIAQPGNTKRNAHMHTHSHTELCNAVIGPDR